VLFYEIIDFDGFVKNIMRVELTRHVEYFDSAPDYRVKLGTLFRLFQEAAVSHSERVGFKSRSLVGAGSVWILNRMAAEIYRFPEYLEEMKVVTWHRGCQGFKAYREFVVFGGNEKVAAASSLWLFYDLKKKRLLKVPETTADAYTVEEERALPIDIDAWKAENGFAPNYTTEITTRASDYDPQGHVNNAAYFDYLETLAFRASEGKRNICGVTIQLQKEIDRTVHRVSAGLSDPTTSGRFKIYSGSRLFAGGDMSFS